MIICADFQQSRSKDSKEEEAGTKDRETTRSQESKSKTMSFGREGSALMARLGLFGERVRRLGGGGVKGQQGQKRTKNSATVEADERWLATVGGWWAASGFAPMA